MHDFKKILFIIVVILYNSFPCVSQNVQGNEAQQVGQLESQIVTRYLDLSFIDKGVYQIVVTIGDVQYQTKIIKQ